MIFSSGKKVSGKISHIKVSSNTLDREQIKSLISSSDILLFLCENDNKQNEAYIASELPMCEIRISHRPGTDDDLSILEYNKDFMCESVSTIHFHDHMTGIIGQTSAYSYMPKDFDMWDIPDYDKSVFEKVASIGFNQLSSSE